MKGMLLGCLWFLQTSIFLTSAGSAHGGEKGPKAKPEEATVHVLGPGSEKALSDLLNLDKPLSTGGALSAKIQETSVLITAGPAAKPTLRVTLVHQADAPRGALRAGGVSVNPKPGPAPQALLTELVARLKASTVALPWQKVVAKPTAEDRAREAREAEERAKEEKLRRKQEALLQAKERTLGRASELVSLGAMEEAKKLLKKIGIVENNGLNISVAIQWMRAGAKAEAMRQLQAVKEPTLDQKLSLKLLRSKLPKGGKALEGADPKVACDLARVAGQALDLRRLVEAENLSHAIRKIAPGCVLAWETELRTLAELKKPMKLQKERVEEALKVVGNTGSIHQIASDIYRFAGDSLRSIEEAFLAARANPKEAGRLEGLARAMSEDPAVLLTYLEKVIGQDFQGNGALVRDFAVGVAYHLAHQYKESQRYLLPLEMVFRTTAILKVYIALNEFNLGGKEQAAKRIKNARVRTEHDVELYYFRAEILRDTDRDQAISDLTKLLPQITKSSKGSATEERRVRSLLEALTVCKKKKTKVCPGDWPHPKTSGTEGQPKMAIPEALKNAKPLHVPNQPTPVNSKSQGDSGEASKPTPDEARPTAPDTGDEESATPETEQNPFLIAIIGLLLLVGVVVMRRSTTP